MNIDRNGATKNPAGPEQNVLLVHASGRRQGSATRDLSNDLVAALRQRNGSLRLTVRDLAGGIPLVSEDWIAANFTAAEDRTAAQAAVLNDSDQLVAELRSADTLVIGVPIYNFGVPASLKAWVDMVARARLTFRYTDTGPEGLLKGKKAYLVVASGGVAIDSAVDFATPYMRQALRFMGIADVDVISAERLNSRGNDALDDARIQIADNVHTAAPVPGVAASVQILKETTS